MHAGSNAFFLFYYFITKSGESRIISSADFILTKVLCMAIIVTIGEI
jgi:hypothetical protein